MRCLRRADLQEAIEKYQQTLQLKPNYPEPYAQSGVNVCADESAQRRRSFAAEKALELARSQSNSSAGCKD